jgi:hypothetical protein
VDFFIARPALSAMPPFFIATLSPPGLKDTVPPVAEELARPAFPGLNSTGLTTGLLGLAAAFAAAARAEARENFVTVLGADFLLGIVIAMVTYLFLPF